MDSWLAFDMVDYSPLLVGSRVDLMSGVCGNDCDGWWNIYVGDFVANSISGAPSADFRFLPECVHLRLCAPKVLCSVGGLLLRVDASSCSQLWVHRGYTGCPQLPTLPVWFHIAFSMVNGVSDSASETRRNSSLYGWSNAPPDIESLVFQFISHTIHHDSCWEHKRRIEYFQDTQRPVVVNSLMWAIHSSFPARVVLRFPISYKRFNQNTQR